MSHKTYRKYSNDNENFQNGKRNILDKIDANEYMEEKTKIINAPGFVDDGLPENCICVLDMCAQACRFPENYTAWYLPNEKRLVFRQDMSDIPDMPCDKEPTEQEAYNWAYKHGYE